MQYLCAGYDRLSDADNKNDESSSIQSQKMIIDSFAKFNNLKIVKHYIDDGYSGGNFDRPEFQEMIKDIENGKINCVITKDLSRLGREMYKTGKYIEEYGYGLYAVECKETQNFLGYVGFHNIAFESDFTPGVEIGWRLCRDAWGKGYATEAASACLDYASDNLPFKTVYSFTAIPNKRSERVMQKIGMHFEKEFDHPLVEQGHWLCRHILYKIEI